MDGIGETSLLDLFLLEAEAQSQALTAALLALERDRTAADQLDVCMRAAHSLKGAARIVGLDAGVRVAHVMEDCLVAARQGRLALEPPVIDRLLGATDLLTRLTSVSDGEIDAAIQPLAALLGGESATAPVTPPPVAEEIPAPAEMKAAAPNDRVLRVTAENVNRLLGLAGEALVESRWVNPFNAALLRLKRMQSECGRSLDRVRDALPVSSDERVLAALADAQRLVLECQRALGQRLGELEMFDRRSLNLSSRLYDTAIAVRMRPFGDGVQGYPRMVRDVAQALGKQVVLEIAGEATQVDRDILGKLDAPLGHLLRNAIDHGIESPAERLAAGKTAHGTIRLEARHSAGMLQVIVSDDGGGIDIERTRQKVVERRMITADAAARLSEAELLEFLFLPGFTMKTTVTDISGRGVGLDAVQDMVRQVRGTVTVTSQPGQGTRFTLHLPVTLSVMRALLVAVGGEPYALPLASILRTVKLPPERIELLEGRQYFTLDERRVGLIAAGDVLETEPTPPAGDALPVVVLGDVSHTYGLVVDRFLGERELVVRPLDAQLGKIRDVSAGALMEDGSPVLILDADDLMRSMDRLVANTRPQPVRHGDSRVERRAKRVLVVDDSITVRELERKLLASRGYDVEVAVDGMDGWNAARTGGFDLVITDIDMPRLDGIELVSLIKKDPALHAVPVMVVSYKDRDDDRRRGLEAGAAYYLTKGSFHDNTLVQAVVDLIGGPHP